MKNFITAKFSGRNSIIPAICACLLIWGLVLTVSETTGDGNIFISITGLVVLAVDVLASFIDYRKETRNGN